MSSELSRKLKILVKNFNNLSLTLATFLGNIAPNSTFATFKRPIEKLVQDESTKIIDTFVLKALVYEKQILEGDEDFFIGKDYKSDLFDIYGNKINDESDNVIMKVFEFKTIWKLLDDKNKEEIKEYMKVLCKIARKYFDLFYELKQLKAT